MACLHTSRAQIGEFLGHSISNAGIHGGPSREYDVSEANEQRQPLGMCTSVLERGAYVQITTDIKITLGDLSQNVRRKFWLEEYRLHTEL